MITENIAIFLLAIIQGITEWFPISSSGHLIIFEKILNYSGGLNFEIALHFGTLMAVFVYFGKDITEIIREFLTGKWKTTNGKTGWYIIIATIPAAILGFYLKQYFDTILTIPSLTALGFAITGVLLLIVSITKPSQKPITIFIAIIIGLAQAIAIIPGISRSGATISTGLLLGLNEKTAMRFSFLLAIPIIFGASIYTLGNNTLSPNLIWATLVSFIVGLLTIHLVFHYILVKKKNLAWFGLYCLILATIIGIYIIK